MLYLFLHIEYLELSKVKTALKVKDDRTAKKWLHENRVRISDVGGKMVVDEFSFEFKRQQIAVENLIKDYPTKWFEIYDVKTEDKGMVKAIRELYPKKEAIKKNSNKRIKKFIK